MWHATTSTMALTQQSKNTYESRREQIVIFNNILRLGARFLHIWFSGSLDCIFDVCGINLNHFEKNILQNIYFSGRKLISNNFENSKILISRRKINKLFVVILGDFLIAVWNIQLRALHSYKQCAARDSSCQCNTRKSAGDTLCTLVWSKIGRSAPLVRLV